MTQRRRPVSQRQKCAGGIAASINHPMAVNQFYITTASDLPAASTPGGRLARAGGWWAVVLSLVMLGSLAEAIRAGRWSDGLGVISIVVMAGSAVSLMLALTRWEAPFALFYGFTASLFMVAIALARVLLPGLTLHDAISELIVRNGAWLQALISNAASADNLVFVTQLAYLCWWLSFFAMWSIFRHQSVAYAAVPVAAALIFNMYFSPYNLRIYLFVFLMSAVLLAVRVELAGNESVWQYTRIRYAPDISADFWKSGLIFALLVIAVAWFMPNFSHSVTLERALRPFQEPWRKITDTWSRMYESVTYPTSTNTLTAFGRSMTLGGPVSLSDRPIFDAEVPTRSYWRATVYDTYTGEGWVNTDPDTRVVDANKLLGEPGFFMYKEITGTIRPLEPGQRTIFAPPHPLRVSVPVDMDAIEIDDVGTQVVASMLRSRVPLDGGEGYKVTSAVTMAPPENLRRDKTEYPEWVTQRYLQLPATLPDRVVQRAQEIAAEADNPYDVATAMEGHLRELVYNQSIPAPPPGADAVDYFLFDVQEGYCDYYASAMAVMLRAVGIPARLVVGYTPGLFTQPTPEDAAAIGSYRVLERNAHAWTEVYFPTYGWIQFEPTASEPRLTRPVVPDSGLPGTTPTPPAFNEFDDRDSLRDLEGGDFTGGPASRQSGLARWIQGNWQPLAIIAGVLAALAVGLLVYRRRQIAFFRHSDLIARLFGIMAVWAGRLHIPWLDSWTPLERAGALEAKVPDASPTLTRLALLFGAERYGRRAADPADLASITGEWQALQPVLWKNWAAEAVSALRRYGSPRASREK